jgi:ethanolamine ammonia-lyase large subunit
MYAMAAAGRRYTFPDLRDLLAKASPLRAGDLLAGVAASDAQERVAAQMALADLPLKTFLSAAVVPYEDDEVTRLIVDSHDAKAFAPFAHMTVGDLRNWLLSDAATTETLSALAFGLTPEMVAAVSKICRLQDLISVAAKCRVVTRFRSTIGLAGRLSARLQPNHPTDDTKGILASIIDGLLLGCGDAVIGINPATDSPARCEELLKLMDELRQRLDIPTQSCVLTHVTTTIELMARGVPVDLVFQSIAGTESANQSFGVNLSILREAHTAALALNRSLHANVMYFETGQGSALSAEAHHGCDQQTLEARAYAVARAFRPLLVNTVVGFIGPESWRAKVRRPKTRGCASSATRPHALVWPPPARRWPPTNISPFNWRTPAPGTPSMKPWTPHRSCRLCASLDSLRRTCAVPPEIDADICCGRTWGGNSMRSPARTFHPDRAT